MQNLNLMDQQEKVPMNNDLRSMRSSKLDETATIVSREHESDNLNEQGSKLRNRLMLPIPTVMESKVD